ncbi:hypothetical protein SAMN05519103_08916 [Rhizobiales bacterium GAS113]|nr:hypothetical protein SAMN05519103_03336 [Rhizobiales bacterium GAS113]SDR63686.1 hypothetical protein SAMN05519103_08916 [Rhizobiales bacterium GAS113]
MDDTLATSYRKTASECRVQAARSKHADDKARWLKLAEQWEALAEQVKRP